MGRRGLITTATDVYGLGSILYALLTGRPPFDGDSMVDTLTKVKEQPPEPPHKINPRVPHDLEVICLKCLEKSPKRRYSSAQGVADDLRAWQEHRPIAARGVGAIERSARFVRRRPALAVTYVLAATVLALAGVGGSLALRWRNKEKAKEQALVARDAATKARVVAEKTLQVEKQAQVEAAREIGRSMTLHDVYDLTRKGRGLSDEQARAIEDHLKTVPEDVESRVKLIGYYSGIPKHPGVTGAFQAHVLWLIEHEPRNPVFSTPQATLNRWQHGDAHARAKAHWGQQVEANPKDPVILENAAEFLLLEESDEAEALLKRCRQLEPRNSAWPGKLGRLLQARANRAAGDDRKKLAGQALEELERSCELTPSKSRGAGDLSILARSAFEAGEYEKAKGYARDLLDGAFPDGGIATHDGNLVLGRLALLADDIAAAKQHLLAAGKTAGAPTLNSFGPNMTLAKELLEVGETQVVLDYFDLCARFWSYEPGRLKLKQWTEAVKAGKAPNFGFVRVHGSGWLKTRGSRASRARNRVFLALRGLSNPLFSTVSRV
jgi:hypothetical protein